MPLDAHIASRLTPVTTTTGLGRTVSALIAKPATMPAPALVLFHAFKGLTDEFKELAVKYADQGYVTVAADLMDGKTSDGVVSAMLRMMFLRNEKTQDTAVSWVNYLRTSSECNGKVGTIGWCFGGRWSLNTSIATTVDATVVYYGTVDRPAEDLSKLKGPVQGHFGIQDRIVKKASVDNFAANMKKIGKPLDLHFYDANHAFANPGGKWFNGACATEADTRTLQFLKSNLG
jgi:carboxymethylenebutenolidase